MDAPEPMPRMAAGTEHLQAGISVAVHGGGYGAGIVRGAAAYVNRHTTWFLRVPREIDAHVRTLHTKGVRCLIIQMLDPDRAGSYRGLGVPVVNVADNHGNRSLPTVISDNRAIGRMAAEHLLDRGFRHFAFCGQAGRWFAAKRHEGYAERLRQAGHVVMARFEVSDRADLGALGTWLAGLPRPVGVLAENDLWALVVIRACDKAGLEVPREVAVLGVDNDEGICETWRVPISSVAVNAEKIGYEAAALLDRMMQGEPPPVQPIEIPPIAVEQRESTAGLGVRDRAVAKAVSAMREGIDQPLTIDDLATALGLSRRHLDRRFLEALGRTAADELRRLRVERARRLLKETNKNVLEIALDCGFSDANRLNAVFHAALGMSPTAYRRQHGAESGSIAGQDA